MITGSQKLVCVIPAKRVCAFTIFILYEIRNYEIVAVCGDINVQKFSRNSSCYFSLKRQAANRRDLPYSDLRKTA
jgi:hypothetical protein